MHGVHEELGPLGSDSGRKQHMLVWRSGLGRDSTGWLDGNGPRFFFQYLIHFKIEKSIGEK
jgi:hypothetical protein